RFALDGGRIVRHHDDRFCAQGPCRIGDALSVIAAGISNHAAASFFRRKSGDFVVCPTQLECANGLQVLRLEIKPATVRSGSPLTQRRLDQLLAHRYASQASLGFVNVLQGDDEIISAAWWSYPR